MKPKIDFNPLDSYLIGLIQEAVKPLLKDLINEAIAKALATNEAFDKQKESVNEWLSTKEVCEILGNITDNTLRKLTSDGIIPPPAVVGKKNLYSREELFKALKANQTRNKAS